MILVTGAPGRVGRAVVCRLASLGHDVVAMVRDAQAGSGRLPSGVALRVADYGGSKVDCGSGAPLRLASD
jgi:NAD(P)H dehydrogenase (quinone)